MACVETAKAADDCVRLPAGAAHGCLRRPLSGKMSRMKRAGLALTLALLALVAPLAARGAPPTDARRDLEHARADVVAASREYRASLDRVLPFREDAVRRASAALETRRRLLALG